MIHSPLPIRPNIWFEEASLNFRELPKMNDPVLTCTSELNYFKEEVKLKLKFRGLQLGLKMRNPITSLLLNHLVTL